MSSFLLHLVLVANTVFPAGRLRTVLLQCNTAQINRMTDFAACYRVYLRRNKCPRAGSVFILDLKQPTSRNAPQSTALKPSDYWPVAKSQRELLTS
jgi:hypothetical protein